MEMDLSDMLENPEVIDLGEFNLNSKPATEPEQREEPERNPDLEALNELRATVASMKEEFANLQTMGKLPGAQPAPTEKPTPKLPAAPTDEQIQKALEDGDTMLAMRLHTQQFALNNFLPALNEVIKSQQKADAGTADSANDALNNLAVMKVRESIESDPSLAPLKQEIVETFMKGNFDARTLLTPGVIDNVINQVVGRHSRTGTWEAPRRPSGMPAGSHAESGESLDPRVRAVFQHLTGMSSVDDNVIRTLSNPRALQIGGREG